MTHYDYTNQAWLKDGVYLDCGHRDACSCFGRLHAGQHPTYSVEAEISERIEEEAKLRRDPAFLAFVRGFGQ